MYASNTLHYQLNKLKETPSNPGADFAIQLQICEEYEEKNNENYMTSSILAQIS